jgi:Acyl-protein synthetase, LuxE
MTPGSTIAPVHESPYAEDALEKRDRILVEMRSLTAFHAERCLPYRRILKALNWEHAPFETLADLPVLPVRLFKELELRSQPPELIVKTLTSSGTTGQRPSRIFLDKDTASSQIHALARIARSFLGSKRLPMLILDHPEVVKERNSFSARAAAIIGFSPFGADHAYALFSTTLQPDWETIEAFLHRHRGERVVLFGFTFVLWHHLLLAAERGRRKLDFGDSILIHGGGWKKLEESKVSNSEFKRRLRDTLGIRSIHNYYGMVEQTGSIFMECERDYFHASDYSEVLVRDPRTLAVQSLGMPGLIECMSTIPRSYPGHILLTEDLGVMHGLDGCACGRRGTYFTVLGRLPRAELRGCSDTHQVPL